MQSSYVLYIQKNCSLLTTIFCYIRLLLSKNYFGKGLTTVRSIGRIYCPITNEYGKKIASPHWINLVNTAKSKYKNFRGEITIQDILNLKEVQ